MRILFIALVLATIHNFASAAQEGLTSKDVSSQIMPLHRIAEQHLATMSDQELDEDWRLNDFFGTLQVINASSNKKGLRSIAQELESIGVFDFEVFPATDGNMLDPIIQKKCEGQHPWEAGRYMTHYRLLKRVKQKFEQAVLDFYVAQGNQDDMAVAKAKEDLHRYRSVLILKDNIGFGMQDSTHMQGTKNGLGRVLRESLKDLPENWDMVYFYVRTYEPTESISPLIQRINKSYYDVAYAVNYRMYGPLCHHLKKIEEPDVPEVRHIDHQISHIHKDFNVYSLLVPLVYLKE